MTYPSRLPTTQKGIMLGDWARPKETSENNAEYLERAYMMKDLARTDCQV